MPHEVILAGLGNIGSCVATLLGGLSGLGAITLVDHDTYTHGNLGNQAIGPDAVGRPKVEVQAERLRRTHPTLQVRAVCDRLEHLPLGRVQDAVVVACFDNRRARQTANRMVWRCGRAYIDGAVQAPSLGRVAVYAPSATAACLVCGWGDEVYANLEQQFPCRLDEDEAAATDAPLELGAFVAALQVAELRKLTEQRSRASNLVGAQYLLDTENYVGHSGHFSRAAHCRFDHRIWDIDAVDIDLAASTLDELFALGGGAAAPALRVEGHRFGTCLDCVDCGCRSILGLALASRLTAEQMACDCGGRRVVPGFYSFETLERQELSATQRRIKLGALGLVADDVVSVAAAGQGARHVRLRSAQREVSHA